MASIRRAFVIMPFGKKNGPDGIEIDFDAVFREFFAPAIEAADLVPHRADAEAPDEGSLHARGIGPGTRRGQRTRPL